VAMATSRYVVSLLAVAVTAVADIQENLNGDYILSQTPGGHDTQAKFPTHYKDYPGGAISFDVYSPLISQLYSQVFWKGLAPVALPADIVKRFDGKGMAVIGFEMDQVRRTKDGDVSVPISAVYNHHFESNMAGKHTVFKKMTPATDPHAHEHNMGHGLPDEYYVVEELGTSSSGLPTHTAFGGANGGEYRKSFHGYAPGLAQVIESPTELQVTPMQIDTWNRDKMNVSHPTKFFPGPLPRNSLAPTENPQYSGMLECPVTTRIRKDVQGGYVAKASGACETGSKIATASECFAAAKAALDDGSANFTFTSVSDEGKPPGCSALADASIGNFIHVFFNADIGTQIECGHGAQQISGNASSLVKLAVNLDVPTQVATITVTGPSDVWFGVGFNASAMKDGAWAIIVDGNGAVTERKLADQNPGKQVDTSVKVISTTTSGNLRTVVMTRAFKGATSDHYTFSATSDPKLNFINAIGSGAKLAYHKSKTPASITMLPPVHQVHLRVPFDRYITGGACVCAEKPAPFGKGKGYLTYVQTSQPADTGSGKINFGNNCAPQPRSDLLSMRNPTCDVRTYVGGQTACHHMFSLLDADQEIPWVDQPLEYHIKFRFWVQEYNASYHTNIDRVTWGIASPVEYDVPKCEKGMTGCEQQADASWVHTITGTFTGGGKLVAAHFHCHAPTCLHMAMYRCAKGTKICNATNGELLCSEKPVYGGTGKLDLPKFDEPGYILQPPCLWGSPEFGLEAPPDTSGFVLGTVKTADATSGHHGEMAWQQMYTIPSTSEKWPRQARRNIFV